MSKRKILIADDEFYIRELVKDALSSNYIILEASDGEEAIDAARKEKPSLILMDIMLPKLDGIGACYILKSEVATKRIPIIMVSVRTDKLDQEYCKSMGSDGYLTKPFSFEALLETVKRFI